MKRGKFFLFLLPAFISLFLLASPVAAETKTVEPSKDTYANAAYPDKVNGNYDHIILSNKYTDRQGFLKFDDISLPAGAVFDQATVRLYLYSASYATTAKVNLGPVTGDWEETSLTWNLKPTIDPSQAIEATIDLATGWKAFSATNLVRKWLDGSLENRGLFLYPYGFLYGTPETEFAITFRSKDYTSNPPQLVIEYHFEPTPTPSPEPTPLPSPQLSPAETPAEETVVSPAPEEIETEPVEASPTPEEKAGFTLRLTSGQAIIGGLTIVFLIAAGLTAFTYSRRQPAKKAGKKEKAAEEEAKE